MVPVAWGVLSRSAHYKRRVHPGISRSSAIDLRAIASRSVESAAAAARELGIPVAHGSYEALLADRAIEAVYIPLPNHLHATWVKLAADAGKHILCEKPFAMNAAEADDAIRHAQSRGVRVMEAFMYPFHPQWQRVRELVRIGEIGQLHAVHVHFSYTQKDPANIRNVLAAGGGGLPDIGCYAVSCARFLLGREPRRAISLIQRDPTFGTDVLSSGMLDFGVARATFTVGTQLQPTQRVDIVGTAGEITVHLPFNAWTDVPAEVTVTNSVGRRVVRSAITDQYVAMFEAFSRAIRDDGDVPIPPQDAIDNMKVLDALFRSEASGSWETVG
ncbi:MAG: Gfo/Idh/MocA family oxidoreductase [Casimicrobiaceae bacterium]